MSSRAAADAAASGSSDWWEAPGPGPSARRQARLAAAMTPGGKTNGAETWAGATSVARLESAPSTAASGTNREAAVGVSFCARAAPMAAAAACRCLPTTRSTSASTIGSARLRPSDGAVVREVARPPGPSTCTGPDGASPGLWLGSSAGDSSGPLHSGLRSPTGSPPSLRGLSTVAVPVLCTTTCAAGPSAAGGASGVPMRSPRTRVAGCATGRAVGDGTTTAPARSEASGASNSSSDQSGSAGSVRSGSVSPGPEDLRLRIAPSTASASRPRAQPSASRSVGPTAPDGAGPVDSSALCPSPSTAAAMMSANASVPGAASPAPAAPDGTMPGAGEGTWISSSSPITPDYRLSASVSTSSSSDTVIVFEFAW